MGAVKRWLMDEREAAFAARVRQLMEENPGMQEHEAGEIAAEEEHEADERAAAEEAVCRAEYLEDR